MACCGKPPTAPIGMGCGVWSGGGGGGAVRLGPGASPELLLLLLLLSTSAAAAAVVVSSATDPSSDAAADAFLDPVLGSCSLEPLAAEAAGDSAAVVSAAPAESGEEFST